MDNEQTIQFIEDYRSHECLWDVHSSSYTRKALREAAYADLGKKHGLTVKGVRNKIKSLRSYFCKEHQRVTERKGGEVNNYEGTWFAYRPLLFIADTVTHRPTKDSFSGSTSIGEANELSQDNYKDDDELPVSGYTSPVEPAFSPIEKNVEQRNILKRKRITDESNEAEAVTFLRTAVAEEDDCSLFGQLVACEIRKLSAWNQAVAKNKIQNVIFNLQMEEMSSQTSAMHPEPHFKEEERFKQK